MNHTKKKRFRGLPGGRPGKGRPAGDPFWRRPLRAGLVWGKKKQGGRPKFFRGIPTGIGGPQDFVPKNGGREQTSFRAVESGLVVRLPKKNQHVKGGKQKNGKKIWCPGIMETRPTWLGVRVFRGGGEGFHPFFVHWGRGPPWGRVGVCCPPPPPPTHTLFFALEVGVF